MSVNHFSQYHWRDKDDWLGHDLQRDCKRVTEQEKKKHKTKRKEVMVVSNQANKCQRSH